MNQSNSSQPMCKSIFKNGEFTTKRLVTEKWIELINRLEKQKDTVAK